MIPTTATSVRQSSPWEFTAFASRPALIGLFILNFVLLPKSFAQSLPASVVAQPVSGGRYRVTFRYTDAKAAQVLLAGSFNQWSPAQAPMAKQGDIFTRTITLMEGVHQYKFVVDGKWIPDPANPKRISDGLGGQNSSFQLGINPRAAAPTQPLSPDTVAFLKKDNWIWKMLGSRDPAKRAEGLQRLESVARLHPNDPDLVDIQLAYFMFYSIPPDHARAAREAQAALDRGVRIYDNRRLSLLRENGYPAEALQLATELLKQPDSQWGAAGWQLPAIYVALSTATPDRARVEDLKARLQATDHWQRNAETKLAMRCAIVEALIEMGAASEATPLINRMYAEAVAVGTNTAELARLLLKIGDLQRFREVVARLSQAHPMQGARMAALEADEIGDAGMAEATARKVMDANLKADSRDDGELREVGTILVATLAEQGKMDEARRILLNLPLEVPADSATRYAIEDVLARRLRTARALKDTEAVRRETEALYRAVSERQRRAGCNDVARNVLADLAVSLSEINRVEQAKAIAGTIVADTPDAPSLGHQLALSTARSLLGERGKAGEHLMIAGRLAPSNSRVQRLLTEFRNGH